MQGKTKFSQWYLRLQVEAIFFKTYKVKVWHAEFYNLTTASFPGALNNYNTWSIQVGRRRAKGLLGRVQYMKYSGRQATREGAVSHFNFQVHSCHQPLRHLSPLQYFMRITVFLQRDAWVRGRSYYITPHTVA
jgi:hypothetical protein